MIKGEPVRPLSRSSKRNDFRHRRARHSGIRWEGHPPGYDRSHAIAVSVAGNYAKYSNKVNEWPVDANMLHDLGYLMHDGGHGAIPSDFDVYIKFMKMHLMA